MEQQKCCAWEVEAKMEKYCQCKDCNISELLQLPYHYPIHTIEEDSAQLHDQDYERIVVAAQKAENVILRLLTFEILQPGNTRKSTNRRIIKHFLLLLSILMYDAQFDDYDGPRFMCECKNKGKACSAIKRIVCLCITNNIEYESIWSYLQPIPKLPLSVVKF